MDSTTSLSKGCFAFAPKSSKSKKNRHRKDEFDEFNSIPQVRQYTTIFSQIEEQLKEINSNASDEVLQELVQFISKCPNSDFAIPTAVLLTGVNLPDHRVLFQALADRLHEQTTKHVAVLLSSECTSVKNTVEQFTSQFLKHSTTSLDPQMDVDESDSDEEGEEIFDDVKRSQCTMPNLVSWYEEQKKEIHSPKRKTEQLPNDKLVIIIPDFESFSAKVLQDVILILSGYLDRLPLVLVFGVATSVKALQSSLPHRITSRMDVRMFQSKQSVHFLNKTVNEVLLSWRKSYPFLLGPKMFKLLTDVFIFYDFSVHGFVQGVKYCLMEHFYNNPLSRLCCAREELAAVVEELDEKDFEYLGRNKLFKAYVEGLPAQKIKKIFDPSNGNKYFKETVMELMNNLHQHKDELLVAVWLLHILVNDLPEAPLGKQVREVYIEAMSGPIVDHPKFQRSFELLNLMSKQELLQKVTEMLSILKESDQLQEEVKKLKDLKKTMASAGEALKSPSASPSKRQTIEKCTDRRKFLQQIRASSSQEENEFEKSRSNLLSHLKKLFQKYLYSPASFPLHEVMLIDNVSAKRHIVGAPRAALHTALNNPHHYLQCDCCKISNNGEILPTMPDICIAYKLHLESGALINMYDWLQSFVTIVSPDEDRDERKVDPAIQARFTRAVSELQFLGFIKASKKKTDHVARLTWGGTC